MNLYDRTIARRRPWWVTMLISLVLVLIPLGAITLDGAWGDIIRSGLWRPILLGPVVILYILVVSQMMAKSSAAMLGAFRPLVGMDADGFDQLVRGVLRVRPAGEGIAILCSTLIGFAMSLTTMQNIHTFWLRIYMPVAMSLMIGLLGWTIFGSFAETKLFTALHRQPLQMDILDIKPFEPVGRYSLVTALAFVGGITLGVIFGLDVHNVLAWQTWLLFLPLMSVPVIVFFLNMGATHRLLAFEKKRQLRAVLEGIVRTSHELQRRLASGERLGELAVEYTALSAYEARLRAASTWPYNIAMLRTLSLTIFAPVLVRGLSAVVFGW